MLKITDKRGTLEVSTFEELDRAFDDIYDIVGHQLTEDGVPLSMEIFSWAELACIGEVWENDQIRVEPIEVI